MSRAGDDLTNTRAYERDVADVPRAETSRHTRCSSSDSKRASMRDRSLLLIALSTSLTAGLACNQPASSSSPSSTLAVRHTKQAIVGGKASAGNEQNAVVAISFTGGASTGLTCTGTLLAPTLVLTARSCVADITAQNTFQDASASSFTIYSGMNAGEKINAGVGAAARGRELYVPATSALEPNVAILLLDTAVNDGVAAIRLGSKASPNEGISTVGFGYNENNKLATTARRQRTGLSVLAIGPNPTEELNAGQFVTGESSCWGDVGGPAFSAKTKAVIGVTTSLGNGQDFAIDNPSASCVGAGTRVIFNDLFSVKELVERAMKAAGATPKLESSGSGATSKDGVDNENVESSDDAEEGAGDEQESVDDSDAQRAKLGDVASQGCSLTFTGRAASANAGAILLLLVALGFGRYARRL